MESSEDKCVDFKNVEYFSITRLFLLFYSPFQFF